MAHDAVSLATAFELIFHFHSDMQQLHNWDHKTTFLTIIDNINI